VRRLPDLRSRLVVHDDAAHELGGAVPTPAAAFLLSMIALPALFWLVMLKRTTVSTAPEEWLMGTVVPAVHGWVETNLSPVDTAIIGLSALGSGWFVALAFAVLGLLALAFGRRDLAAFCVARLAHDHRQGRTAYLVAVVLIGAISATRIYLGAHYPMDVLGGWIAGGSLLAILVAIHVLQVDERAHARELASRASRPRRRVAVPRRAPAAPDQPEA
jgi:membrane-associated phospholipid phosphatase